MIVVPRINLRYHPLKKEKPRFLEEQKATEKENKRTSNDQSPTIANSYDESPIKITLRMLVMTP